MSWRALARIVAMGAAVASAGCFSLIPLPTGHKSHEPPAGPPVVDGKVFGTGVLRLDGWELELLVAPSSVAVADSPQRLVVTGNHGKIGGPNGDFELTVRRKAAGETARSALAKLVESLDHHSLHDDAMAKTTMGTFALPAVSSPINNDRDLMAFATVAEHGQCIYELLIVAADSAQYVTLERATQAGIRSTTGQAPLPPPCR